MYTGEPNYAITIYVAEFFNTISSLPMILLGLLGIYYTTYIAQFKNEKRYTLCFIALVIVGIGSVTFHATLRWHFQLLDELPMMTANYIFLYTILETSKKEGSPTNWTNIIILSLVTLMSIIGYVIFKLWFLFIGSYTFGIIMQWISLFPYLIDTKNYSIKAFITLLITYYGGLVLWILDLHQCELVKPYHFHSLWHIGAGYGTYIYLLMLVSLRIKILKKDNKIKLEFPTFLRPIHSIQIIKQHEG